MNRHYDAMSESDSFFEFTAFDESGPLGHLIMRFTNDEKTTLRLGFVIVDPRKRGRGYGREMLNLTIRYAFDLLKVEKITLGVFENNLPACRRYRAAGFRETPCREASWYHIGTDDWNCMEMALTKGQYSFGGKRCAEQ